MGGGLKSLRGLTKSIPAANRGRGPLGGVKRDFTRLNRKYSCRRNFAQRALFRDQWIARRQGVGEGEGEG